MNNETEENKIYLMDDDPKKAIKDDKLNRKDFANRVAQLIIESRGVNGLVIGLYGPWGSGKSTILNFVEELLNEKDGEGIIPIRFNPWLFEDETVLLLSFFKEIGYSVKGKIKKRERKKEIGKWVKNISRYIPGITFGGAIVVDIPKTIKSIGEDLSKYDLDKEKDTLSKILREENKKIVILMDDIDRLDKNEIQVLFKVVKICANFANTYYVMAFDKSMVAAALQDKYASQDGKSGESYLEKIVQIPLDLPKPYEKDLLDLSLKCITNALDVTDLIISEDQGIEFVRYYQHNIFLRIKTPRDCKRFSNALIIILPLLKGEIYLPDLLLIEGIRFFYPKMFEIIKEFPQYFTDYNKLGVKEKNQRKEIIEKGWVDLSLKEKGKLHELLNHVFPLIRPIFENYSYDSSFVSRWEKDQRIATLKYLIRYLHKAVPTGDVSDIWINIK